MPIHTIKERKDKAILVGLQTESQSSLDLEESLQELAQLAETANIEVVHITKQSRPHPHPAYYIGSGKARMLANLAKRYDANIIVFDDNLTSSQDRNLYSVIHRQIIDRSQLILDIFAQHAKTYQSKIQVELAQLEYNLSRLKHQWQHLSRIEGGIGLRGPGEKQLEVDRRRIHDRIALLKAKLQTIEKTVVTKKKQREDIFSVGLVGYTNAGKTSILNRLTQANRYTADKLFATLDTTTRRKNLSSNDVIVVSDTVGFIRKLPPYLIASFHATLQEVISADLLLHVIDISHPKLYQYIETVLSTLEEIGADDNNMIFVFNKIDLLLRNQLLFLKKKLHIDFPNSIFISTKTGENFSAVEKKIIEILRDQKKEVSLKIPNTEQKMISFIYKYAEVLKKRYNNGFVRMKIRIPNPLYAQNFDEFRKYEFKTKRMAKRREVVS
jgi:GTP-binding protein HflX